MARIVKLWHSGEGEKTQEMPFDEAFGHMINAVDKNLHKKGDTLRIVITQVKDTD